MFNLLIKAAADLIVIPNRSALSFPRLVLSPLLAWLVSMFFIYPKGLGLVLVFFFFLTVLILLRR